MNRRHFLATGLLALVALKLPGRKVKVFELRGDLNNSDLESKLFQDDVERPEVKGLSFGRDYRLLDNGDVVYGDTYFKVHRRYNTTKLPDGTLHIDADDGERYEVLNNKFGLGELIKVSEKYFIHRFVVI